ncbi:hypothetical protein OGY35_23800 [Citrobacter sp. Ct235]|uniref:hypothetical protein n=1 Tax=Citrobacter sp. Ct235 TaxID=2985157 RepID=UPI002576D3EE|nr:hypothetical protein [Citrobacter sp. Ct235]MDM2738380.1 hypothetical protein [Citrobacter sp. Ct235]
MANLFDYWKQNPDKIPLEVMGDIYQQASNEVQQQEAPVDTTPVIPQQVTQQPQEVTPAQEEPGFLSKLGDMFSNPDKSPATWASLMQIASAIDNNAPAFYQATNAYSDIMNKRKAEAAMKDKMAYEAQQAELARADALAKEQRGYQHALDLANIKAQQAQYLNPLQQAQLQKTQAETSKLNQANIDQQLASLSGEPQIEKNKSNVDIVAGYDANGNTLYQSTDPKYYIDQNGTPILKNDVAGNVYKNQKEVQANTDAINAAKAGISNIDSSLSIANDILDKENVDAFKSVSGNYNARTPTILQSSKDMENKINILKDQLSLNAREKLAGQGAISNFEGEMLAKAEATFADPTSSYEMRRQALENSVKILKDSKERLQSKLGIKQPSQSTNTQSSSNRDYGNEYGF